MADTVRYLMEEMVPELQDMVKKKYFTRSEIKQIVKRREDFEYLLKRKAAQKPDFLRYIEYESRLEQLRQHRRTSLGITGKKTLADYAIVRRVHFIFERATRKFKRDLRLWAQWLQFCKETGSSRRLSRVAAKALQLHPGEPDLWVYAAEFEFEHNANPGAARALMQQGLRMCKGSAQLWAEYFNMEMMYVQKLRARRKVLGLDLPEVAGVVASGGQQGQEGQEAASDGEGPEGAGGGGGRGGAVAGTSAPAAQQQGSGGGSSEEAVAAVLSGAVAAVVAANARAALPGDLGLRRKLLALAARYRFPGASVIRAQLREAIAAELVRDPEAADLLARDECDPGDATEAVEKVDAAIGQYERVLRALAGAAASGVGEGGGGEGGSGGGGVLAAAAAAKRRWLAESRRGEEVLAQRGTCYRLYAAFLRQRVDALLAAGDARGAAAAGAHLLRVLARAHEDGSVSEEVYVSWVDAARLLGQAKMAVRAARLATERLPALPAVWEARISAEAELQHGSNGSNGSVCGDGGDGAAPRLTSTLEQALRAVPAAAAAGLWQHAVATVRAARGAGAGGQLHELQSLLLVALMGAGRAPAAPGGMGAATGALLEATWQLLGRDDARHLFERVLVLPPPGPDAFRSMVALERMALAEAEQQLEAAQQQAVQRQAAQRHARVDQGPSTSSATATAAVAAAAASVANQVQRVRHVFEAALAAYGAESAALWLELAEFERSRGAQGAGDVYWRATKALRDPEPFVIGCREGMGLQ